MKAAKKLSLWLLGALFAVALVHTKSYAASTQTITITVSINATKSISVSTSNSYNFGALGINVSSVSSPIVVTNDSGGLQELYQFQGANATGITPWTLASSTGAIDTYALAVQFSSNTPTNVDASWGSDDLTTGIIQCSATAFGNGTAGESGLNVFPITGYNVRNMWFRIKTPVAVTDATTHTASVTLGVY